MRDHSIQFNSILISIKFKTSILNKANPLTVVKNIMQLKNTGHWTGSERTNSSKFNKNKYNLCATVPSLSVDWSLATVGGQLLVLRTGHSNSALQMNGQSLITAFNRVIACDCDTNERRNV